MKVDVYCSLTVEGVHKWTDCNIKEVEYLKLTHRHLFKIKAYKSVSHNDRDIEFIKLKHAISDYLNHCYFDKSLKLHNFLGLSCEQIGRNLMKIFDLSKIEVSEDGENGIEITRD